MDFSPRKEAADALIAVLRDGAYASLHINKRLRELPPEVGERDRRFYSNLIYTTLEHLPSLDHLLSKVSSVPVPRMKAWVAVNLRMALAQILYMDKIPESAAISQCVELVKKSSCGKLSGFCNGVLRGAQRMGYKAPLPDEKAEETAFLSVTYDMPEDIVSLWLRSYGRETAEKLLLASRGEKALCVRANLLRTTEDELAQKLTEEGLSFRKGLPGTGVFFPVRGGSFGDWDLYREGLLYAQDESSVLAALALGARPGERVLDLCAAPGGKSAVIAQEMKNTGEIVSRDLHEHRVELIRGNMARLGASAVKAEVSDGTARRPEDRQSFDRVLLDAPCSGYGVLRGKPDIKVRGRSGNEEELTALQKTLLETAAEAVKPGGRLVYSTCTLNPAENDAQVEDFLRRHPEYRLLTPEETLPSLSLCDKITKTGITLFPQPDGRDGFFLAALERVG